MLVENNNMKKQSSEVMTESALDSKDQLINKSRIIRINLMRKALLFRL
jgi:hypothetical protein